MAKLKLADALQTSNHKNSSPVPSDVIEASSDSTNIEKRVRIDSRTGKKHVGAYFDSAVALQLTVLAAELSVERNEKVKMQDLLGEAINDLFQKHNKSGIA